MKYKHIVFDIDGTLLNNEYAVLRSFQDTLKTVTGETVEMEELDFCLGITGEDSLKRLDIEDIPSVLALWVKNLYGYEDTVRIFDGIDELLETLTKAGYELGIVSSKTRGDFEHTFSKYSIAKYFKTSICAEDTEDHKPLPAPLLKYMELSGTKSNNLLYIGDSRYDSECAKNAGVDFALAVWGHSREEIQADYYLNEPLDLLSAIS